MQSLTRYKPEINKQKKYLIHVQKLKDHIEKKEKFGRSFSKHDKRQKIAFS